MRKIWSNVKQLEATEQEGTMNQAFNKLENEIRAELMLRKSGKRSAKYSHLNNNEIYILALAMTRKLGVLERKGEEKE